MLTIILSINPLVSPDPGLFIWSAISFLVLLFVLKKMAWKPITEALDERERFISDSLNKAEAAKEDMDNLIMENEALIKQTRIERDGILAEAKRIKEQIIGTAKDAATKEATKMIELARIEINNQKVSAIADIKNQVATLSLDIAEKILRKQFEDHKKQDELVSELLKEVKLN